MFDDSKLKEEFLTGERVYSGKVIRVDACRVRLPDGNTALREIVHHNGAVAIIPIDHEGYVTLVRQDRIAIGRLTWEIPAGKLEGPDEDPFSAAVRELEEETGLHAAHWQELTVINTTAGFCDEKITIYLATELSQHSSHTDDDEFLSVARFPLDELTEKVMRGELQDSKTIIALLMAGRVVDRSQWGIIRDAPDIQRFNTAIYSGQAEKNVQ